MKEFNRIVQVRWSDLDPNFHIRHSVYYDWGAFCRGQFLNQYGLTTGVMQQLKIGLILFREECIFRKEIQLEDEVQINLHLMRSKKDFSRWSIQHQIVKNGNVLSAVINVDGAWLDVIHRKLAVPPQQVHDVFSNMPQGEGFEWM